MHLIFNQRSLNKQLDDSISSCINSVEDGTTHLLDEPVLSLLLGHTLELSDAGLTVSTLGDSVTSTLKDDIEVHTKNTSVGVVLDAQVDVFVDTETKVA